MTYTLLLNGNREKGVIFSITKYKQLSLILQ